jgi:uncharacterized protein (TIGR00304 family)
MKSRMWVPIIVFLAGVAFIVTAAASGNAEVQLFIIFPLISGTSWLFVLGVVLIIASFVLGFVLAASSMGDGQSEPEIGGQAGQESQAKNRYGGVVLIGPIPIIFGSDRRMALVMLVIAIVIFAAVLAIALLSL